MQRAINATLSVGLTVLLASAAWAVGSGSARDDGGFPERLYGPRLPAREEPAHPEEPSKPEPEIEPAPREQDTRQRNHWMWERWWVGGGLMLSTFNSTVRVDGSGGVLGTEINLEDDLDMDKDAQLYDLRVNYRPSRRQLVVLEYIRIRRDGARTLSGTIKIGDKVFDVGFTVNSFFDQDLLRLAWGYSPIMSKRWEVGFLVGAHFASNEFGIKTEGGLVETGFKLDAPLPNLVLHVTYAFADRWAIWGEGQAYRLSIDNFAGGISMGNLAIAYTPVRDLTLYLGYNTFGIDIEETDKFFDKRYRYSLGGPSFFVRYGF